MTTLYSAINYAKNIMILVTLKSDEIRFKLTTSLEKVNTLLTKAETFGEWSSKPTMSAESQAKIALQEVEVERLYNSFQDGLYNHNRELDYDTECDILQKMIYEANEEADLIWASSAPQEVLDFVEALVDATNNLKIF